MSDIDLFLLLSIHYIAFLHQAELILSQYHTNHLHQEQIKEAAKAREASDGTAATELKNKNAAIRKQTAEISKLKEALDAANESIANLQVRLRMFGKLCWFYYVSLMR